MTSSLPAINPDGRYTMCDTARIFQVNNSTLWRWVKAGKIAVAGHFKVNGRPYINGREIIRVFNGKSAVMRSDNSVYLSKGARREVRAFNQETVQ